MSTAHGIPTGEELERQMRWIRRLAGALLRDEAAADDLAQEAWLAALNRPAGAGVPWLRGVVRNLARQHHRASARRAERESAPRPAAAPDEPDAFAQRLEAVQALTRELAALEEPFRSTLVLRYFDELEPAAIAARLGLPGGTVRWRLMRGLELLRARLDRAHGGDRRAWSLGLAPLTHVQVAAGAGAVGTAVVFPGVLLVNALKLSAAAAALLVLALGLSLTGLLPDSFSLGRRSETPLEVAFRPLAPEPAAPAPDDVTAAAALGRQRVAPVAAPDLAPVAAVADAQQTTIDARLFGGGRALQGARLVVLAGGERLEARSGAADGLVTRAFPLAEPRALVRIELHAFGFASQARAAVCEQGRATHLGRIELLPGGAVSGRVVDELGRGVAGACVTFGSLDESFQRLEAARLEPAPYTVPTCTSDAAGRFVLAGVAEGMARLWGHAAGRKAGYSPPFEVRAGQESLDVELVLEPLAPANVLRGIVLDPHGAPVPRAEIAYRFSLFGGSTMRSGSERAGADGRFEFLLPEGARAWLSAGDPEGHYQAGSAADVPTGAPDVVLQLHEARSVELAVRDRAGEFLGPFALELRSADGETRIGGIARAEHPEGRARFAVPDRRFVVRVEAVGHRTLELGPFASEQVGAALECTLEPVPGLHGTVLRGGEPAPGVRVVLQAEAEPDTRLEVDGMRVRVYPDPRDEAETDVDGRFVLTPRAAGRYVVRAEPATSAPAEFGPFPVDAGLGGPPIELHLGLGGAIEGRVRLANGADVEGSIVGITRGDGAGRTRRVGRDGAFRFEALVPGPWRVELCETERFGPPRSVSSTRGPSVKPFELAANCTVYEGRTAYVDVTDAAPDSVVFAGRLLIDARPAVGWAARFGPVGLLEFEEAAETMLDSDGRFELRVSTPGGYRLMLRRAGGERQEQYLFEDVTVRAGAEPWERELHTGRLRLEGLGTWDGNGTPRAVHYWKGPGGLFGLAVPVADADDAHAIDVPAGRAELRAPSRAQDPEAWKVLRTIEVPRGGELRVELTPADLGGG